MFHSLFAVAIAVTTFLPTLNLAPVPADVWSGKVVEVQASSISIRNPADGQNVEFVVNSATVITRNGKVAALSEIQLEDRAEIMAVKTGDKFVAKTVRALARK